MKALVERSVVACGVARLARRRLRDGTLILAYHNVIPKGEQPEKAVGDRSLHLSQTDFAQQLDIIGRTHDVVPLESVLQPASGRRPRAVITFDDAYRGAVNCAVKELTRRGMPATIFVAPAFVGDGTFWWDAIAPNDNGLPDDVRARCLEELRGEDAPIREWARGAGLAIAQVPSHARCATEQELRAAASNAGITLASHTWSHANLAREDAPRVDEELSRPLVWLRQRFPQTIPWLSYPYGLYSPSVENAAQAAGYVAALRVEGGWMTPRNQLRPYALPRLNVPSGVSPAGFTLRLSGLVR